LDLTHTNVSLSAAPHSLQPVVTTREFSLRNVLSLKFQLAERRFKAMSDTSKRRLGALLLQLDGARSVCDSGERHGSNWQCARSLRGCIHITFIWYQGSAHNLTVGTVGEDEYATNVSNGDGSKHA
jgi:hypothetical protein